MREIIARVICGVTVGLVLALSLLFAFRHNPMPAAAPVREPARSGPVVEHDPEIERGRRIFTENDCAACHAVAGRGNPRYPLDGVGSRRSPMELRQYVTGTGVATGRLSSAVVRRKQRYQELTKEDMAALVQYLSSLANEH